MASECPSLLHGTRARLQEQISGIVQVVCQLDDKDGASSLDLEDLAIQTQVQVNEIVAAVAERLQQVERHLQAEHDDSVLRDTCKEVENQVTELRSGLQLVQRAQEGLERHQMDAMASVIQDVQRTSSEVHNLRSDLTRLIDRLSIALDVKDRTDLQSKDLRAQLAWKQTDFEDFLSFCSTGIEMLAQELQHTCKQHEESLRGQYRGEVDSLERLLRVQSLLRQMLRELKVAVFNDMASQQSKLAALRADLHNQHIRAEAAETSHAGVMKTLSEVVQWHRHELHECQKELEDSQAKVNALVDDLALTTTSACTLSEQKQQAEASLHACREYIAYLQEVADQEESEVESYKCVHEHVLMESQSQMDHLKAAFQASDYQMQAAQQQIAAHVDKVAILQAEQEALAAVIQQQREVMAEQSTQKDRDYETIACLEVCIHSAVEEMELMCSTTTSAMQSLRETSRPTIAAELKSTQQQLTDLRCFVQKSIVHMQDTKRLLYHHMEDTDGLSLQTEIQNLSAELLHSRQSCDGWREKHDVQVKEANRVKKEYESHMEAQSSATQALQEEICTLKAAIIHAEEHHRNVSAHAALQADERLTVASKAAQTDFVSQQSQATEQLTRDLQDKNERETQAWQAMMQEKHTGEIQALEAALAHERQGHAALLDDLVGRHEQICAALRQQGHHELVFLRQQHEDALAALIQQHRQTSQAAATASDGRLQSALAQAEEKIACQLAAQQVMHEQQLATAHAAAEQHVQETVADWQQRCRAEQEAAHAMKMDELAQLSRSQAAAMAQCQDRHAEEVAALEASVKHLRECVEQQRIAAESQQASHVSMMAQALHDLASKDTALELAAEQHREETINITAKAEGRMQTLGNEHASHIEDMQKLHKAAILEQQIEAEARMEELNDQLAALKQRFDARESRREDVEKLRHLAQALADRDASILDLHADLGKMENKVQQLHREMILREDNYTKTFVNGGAGMRVPDVRQALNTPPTVVDWMIKQPPSQSKRNTRK